MPRIVASLVKAVQRCFDDACAANGMSYRRRNARGFSVRDDAFSLTQVPDFPPLFSSNVISS
jgi:hypothetical protein